MKLISSLLLSLVGLSASRLVAVSPATNADFEELINSGYDVRGLVDETIFLDTYKLNELPSKFSQVNWISSSEWKPAAYSVISGGSHTFEWIRMEKSIKDLPNRLKIVYETDSLIVVAIKDEKDIDVSQVIPMHRETEFTSLPSNGIQRMKASPVEIIQNKLDNLEKRESVSKLIGAINQKDLRYFNEFLSGEGNSTDFMTRHSLSRDAVRSGQWAVQVFQSYGFNASLDYFQPSSYCPNVIAEKKGTRFPNQVVVLGAHLDCRNRNIDDSAGRAPGANDDGSGSSAVLQIAKAIFDTKSTFESTLRLALWCGEEQGLVGSRDYAKRAANTGMNILGMFQADMIGYQSGPQPQCAFVDRYTQKELTNYAKEIAALYVPQIQRVDTSACCSDHQSFYENGYPSVGFVEGGGYIIDPKYHNVDDTVNRSGFSLNQMESIAKIMAASASDLAGVSN